MKKYLIAVYVFNMLLSALPAISQIDYKGFPEWSLQKKDSTEYALYTPDHLQAGKKYPVVLFMHGCCGVDNHATLRNAVDPPVRMWHQFGANKQSIPTYIIAPATARGWKQHFAALKSIIDDLIANHQGDPQRVYVTGFSMGGEGTFRIIQEYPGFFAAAIPMGMSFFGDSLKVKDMPIWANQGETDYYSRNLRSQVAAIRKLNAPITDTGSTLITGVYPRYSNFKGVGHGVQWDAASTQDLTTWAYSKINDGNKEPWIFFNSTENPIHAQDVSTLTLALTAGDPDGSINRITVFLNHQLYKTLTKTPYQVTLKPSIGDNLLEAIAYDNKGKSGKAIIEVHVKTKPALSSAALVSGFAGSYYQTRIKANGNGNIVFSAPQKNEWPEGIELFPDGTIQGMTAKKGMYKVTVRATDENEQSTKAIYTINIKEKRAGSVLVTAIMTDSGAYKLSTMALGAAPFFNRKDTMLSTAIHEINFSSNGPYAGMTFIQTAENDAGNSNDTFLDFAVDENVMVYVAYEKLDKLLNSTIPAWLKEFKKEPGQIVAQYRYFDVYSKPYKKGLITLPGADAAHNGVGSNYFVMIKKQ